MEYYCPLEGTERLTDRCGKHCPFYFETIEDCGLRVLVGSLINMLLPFQLVGENKEE